MSELKPIRNATASQAVLERRQAHRKILALALLLIAFVAVIVKDWDFWFGADESQEAELSQTAVAPQTPVMPAPRATAPARPAAIPTAKKQVPVVPSSQPKPAEPAVVATKRTAVPALNVEVIAGDSHRTISPGSNTTKVELNRPASASNSRTAELTATLAAPTKAAQVERVSALHPATGSFDGSYPLLAQQMRVQGSVVLQALIGSDGLIQNLRVLNGPRILATAAQQAVREWRFKPYLENGQPVETKATITVNFTINVADGTMTTASLNAPPLQVIQLGE